MQFESNKKSPLRAMTLLFVFVVVGGAAGCASQSFSNFKQKLVSRSDEIVITFYDSKTMNAETLKELTEFSVDNSAEVSRFRRFILSLRSRDEDCRADGKLNFVSGRQHLQQMEFNLENRCVTVIPVNAQGKQKKSADMARKRLSRTGVAYLEALQQGVKKSESSPPQPTE